MNKMSLRVLSVMAVCGLLVGVNVAPAQDVFTIGSATVPGGTGVVTVPLSLLDKSGTPIGRDRAAGLRISGWSAQIVYGPLACVTATSVKSLAANGIVGTFVAETPCGGVINTAPKIIGTSQTHLFNASEGGPDPCGTFPLTLDAPAPGDHLVDFQFTLTACPMGTVIPLHFDLTGALLNSDSGTAETVANGGLALVDGTITVPAPTVTLSPDPLGLTIGSSGQMTVTLDMALPADTIVGLGSSDPTKATVPATVTVLANQTTATFTVVGVGVGSSTITATLPVAAGGATDTAVVNVAPVTIALSPDPLNLVNGGSGNMTVTINPVQTTNVAIGLGSSDPTKATVPVSVTILANQATATFAVSAVGVGASTITGTLPADFGSGTDTATVNVAPVTITLSPKPLPLVVGTSGNFTVTINPVQTVPVVIGLVSADPTKATVPANVTILANQATATFAAAAVGVGSSVVTATLPALYGSGTDTATVNVTPVTVALTPDPLGLLIGGTGNMTATLSTAQATATVVNLVSSDPTKATVPATVTIPANQASAIFTVTAVAVGSSTITATLPAPLGGGTDTAIVNVSPVSVTLTPDPRSVVVGATGQMTLTIAPLQATATIVTLVSSDPTKATVPVSVSVPATGSATFNVTGVAVGSSTITATLPVALGSANDTAVVNVTGITVALTPDPLTITVAGSGLFTVTLGAVQPGAVVVALASSDATKVTVPATVTVPANTASATFTASGVAVGSSTITATLPAPLGGATDTATADVLAVSIISVVGPSSLRIGVVGQATITISAPAPAGGITFSVIALPAGIVSVPSSVMVPVGQTTATFNVTGVAPGTATVTVSLGGASQSFQVTVVPEPIPTLSGLGMLILAGLLAVGALFLLRRSVMLT